MNQASKQSNSPSPLLPTSPPNSNQIYPHSYLNGSPAAGYNQQFMHNNFNANYNPYSQQPYWNGYPNHQHSPQQQSFYPPNYYQNPYQNQNFSNYNRFQQGFMQPNQNGSPMNMNFNNNRSPNNYQKNNNFNKKQWNNKKQNNNNINNINNNQQNDKINKQDLPENNQFYCEVCDRGFKTNQLYDDHCKTHTTCGHNGCKFTAAAKLVKIHFTNFHASGIDKKIPSLETPDEIQKYINDRKKNFPTASNLDKKIKLDNEKIERGVALETRQFGRFNKNKQQNKITINPNKNEDLKEDSKENEISNTSEETAEQKKYQNNDHLASANSANQFSPRNSTTNKRIKKKNKKNKLSVIKPCLSNIKRKPTLLQQLLANEIRHERNILLQCVKYVVENNFFDQTNCNLAGDAPQNMNEQASN